MADQPQAEPALGVLAQQAGRLCRDPRFCQYLDQRRRWREGLSPIQLPDGTHTTQDAIDTLRQACGITSRTELDHNPQAGAMFKRIASDFNRWTRRAGQ